MARMYPDLLPDAVESAAERTLYTQFKAQLPAGFVVLHSVKWLMRDRRRFDRDGEIDFLVLHPDLGVLVLEVKGGRVRLDGSTGRWYTKNRFDEESELKESPFDQARRNLHNLLSKLEEAPKTRLYSYRTQRGVALPDITVGDTDFGLYGDREIMIDSTDMFRLEAAIRRIMGTPQQRPALSDAAINALIDTVQPSLSIERIGLGTHVVETEERLASLTAVQYAALDLLQGHPRVAISGCAGSGKTMLAMEKARRLASEGFTVLFTCFNRNLAHWIDARFRDDPYTVNERIFVRNYHDLVLDICRQTGVAVPPVLPTASGQVRSTFFNETLPQKLEEALASSKARFDVIIADEGQDFAEDWWITLLDLLKNREHGVFYIFFDDNQRIYPRDAPLPISEAPFTLSVNCRNTDKIHDEVLQYYRGTPKPISRGPVGIAPTFEPLESGGNREALRRAFATLFTHEKLPPRSVVVLTPLSARTSGFKEGDRIGAVTLTWQRNPGPNEVQVSSIYSYKGLESPVVILAELDRLDPEKKDYLLYVATSRPRDHLIVLGALPEPQNEETSLSADQRWGGDDVSF